MLFSCAAALDIKLHLARVGAVSAVKILLFVVALTTRTHSHARALYTTLSANTRRGTARHGTVSYNYQITI